MAVSLVCTSQPLHSNSTSISVVKSADVYVTGIPVVENFPVVARSSKEHFFVKATTDEKELAKAWVCGMRIGKG